MPGINDNFRSVTGERIITSYDFLDIAKGNAIQRFFAALCMETSSGTLKYALSDTAFYSTTTSLSVTTAWAPDWYTAAYNFDVEFRIPRIIKGDAYASVSMGLDSAAGYGHEGYVLMELKKVSTATTTLATAKSTVLATPSQTKLDTLYFNVPLTTFKIGDKLRLTVTLYAREQTDGPNAALTIGCDPKNRTVSGIDSTTSILDLYVPFKIQL